MGESACMCMHAYVYANQIQASGSDITGIFERTESTRKQNASKHTGTHARTHACTHARTHDARTHARTHARTDTGTDTDNANANATDTKIHTHKHTQEITSNAMNPQGIRGILQDRASLVVRVPCRYVWVDWWVSG